MTEDEQLKNTEEAEEQQPAPEAETPQEESATEEGLAEEAPEEPAEEPLAEPAQTPEVEPLEPEAPKLGKWRRRMLDILLHESDREEEDVATLLGIVRRMDGEWFLRQMPLVLVVVIFMIVRTTSHYQWQQQLIDREEINRQIEDVTYRATAISSDLTEKMRQSKIERKLKMDGDSTLLPSVETPFVINISPEDE
ncbi:MAG: hypothetical protein LUI09_02020 [Prevotellaceae bacterium]|nr:hypothetical protein [Prevotellaceae bacterium]